MSTHLNIRVKHKGKSTNLCLVMWQLEMPAPCLWTLIVLDGNHKANLEDGGRCMKWKRLKVIEGDWRRLKEDEGMLQCRRGKRHQIRKPNKRQACKKWAEPFDVGWNGVCVRTRRAWYRLPLHDHRPLAQPHLSKTHREEIRQRRNMLLWQRLSTSVNGKKMQSIGWKWLKDVESLNLKVGEVTRVAQALTRAAAVKHIPRAKLDIPGPWMPHDNTWYHAPKLGLSMAFSCFLSWFTTAWRVEGSQRDPKISVRFEGCTVDICAPDPAARQGRRSRWWTGPAKSGAPASGDTAELRMAEFTTEESIRIAEKMLRRAQWG